jgi:hypothetical protein
MRRDWRIEFEEAEIGEVFVRADLKRTADANNGPIRPTGIHYERTGTRVEPTGDVAGAQRSLRSFPPQERCLYERSQPSVLSESGQSETA